MLEVPLMLTVVIATYLLLDQRLFESFRYSAVVGIALAMILLVKWNGVIFVVPILFFQTYRSGIRKSVKHLGIIAITTILIAGPWYLANFDELLANITVFSQAEVEDPTGLTAGNLTFYVEAMHREQLLWPLTFSFFVSIFAIVKRREKQMYPWLGLIAFIYLVFTVVPNKDYRYDFGIIVPIYILVGDLFSWLYKSKKQYFWFAVLPIILFNLHFYFLNSALHTETISTNIELPVMGKVDIFHHKYYHVVVSPDNRGWQIASILHTIKELKPGGNAVVLVNVDKARIHPGAFRIVSKSSSYEDLFFDHPDVVNPEDLESIAELYEFILIPENSFGSIDDGTRGNTSLSEDVIRNIGNNYGIREYVIESNRYKLIKEFQLPQPDLDTIYLFQRQI